MPERYRNTYAFRSSAAPADAFEVVRFTGEEGLSRPYAYDILLMSSRKDLDPTTLVQSPAVFTIKLDRGDLPIHGIPALFELQNAYQGHAFYRVTLAPKLWWLTLTRHNQIFLDQNLQEFLTQALTDGGLTEGQDFEFRLAKTYPTREYVCQYRESHFDFVSRWMERDGLYYFFEQGETGEKMVITDARTTHTPLAETEPLLYLPPSGLDWPVGVQSVKRFSRIRHRVPQTVTVTDYNYRKPDVRPQGQHQVSPRGQGECHIFGEHAQTADEASALAQVRAEGLGCRETVFEGLSAVPHLRPGYLFRLQGHFRDDCNATYLTTLVRHEGGQEAYLAQAMGLSLAGAPDTPYYRNTFSAISGSVQYRAEPTTEKPRFYGVLSAKIDAAQSGQYAELDDQGRYKVILPFDLSGRQDGKASSWLRMIQPYGGSGHGFHFPLHKGCEVLLVFLDGDPDRPVIQAAVPNPDHKSLLTSDNNTKCLLTSAGGNTLHIEDQEGSERILMQSPTQNSWARCGHPNDPPSAADWTDSDDMLGWKLNTNGTMSVQAGLCNEIILGTVEWEYIGNCHQSVVGEAFEFYGVKKVIGVVKNVELNFVTLAMRLRRQATTGISVALNEECVSLAGELTKMNENATKLEAMRQSLEAQKTALTTSKQTLTDTKQRLTGEKVELGTQKTALEQELQQMAGTKQTLQQAKQTIIDSYSELLAQKMTLVQLKTELTLSNTETGAQITTLRTQNTELCEMRSAITGFRSME
jgi:type VI secretion system secreted protein VgrG